MFAYFDLKFNLTGGFLIESTRERKFISILERKKKVPSSNKTSVSVHVSGSDSVSISDTEGPLAVTHLNFKQRGKQFNISIVQISISNIEI